MTTSFGFIGDIHGSDKKLRRLLSLHEVQRLDTLVFLGDYVNKGRESKSVIDFLIQLSRERSCIFLQGNHDLTFQKAIQTGDIVPLLKIGGSSCIRSYLQGTAPADVSAAFLSSIPDNHRTFLNNLEYKFESIDFIASHKQISSKKFSISGHLDVGQKPLITELSAQIDTGAGSRSDGLLTALRWPDLHFFQA